VHGKQDLLRLCNIWQTTPARAIISLIVPGFQGGHAFMKNDQMNRREFMGNSAGAAALGAISRTTLLSPRPLQAAPRVVPPSDRVRFASIGTGVEGCTIAPARKSLQPATFTMGG
jgi:hypothetical protein